jgi:hypothetical protein
MFPNTESDHTSSFLVGMTAGGLNGAVLSPLSVVKYYGWGTDRTRSFFHVAVREIWAKGGLAPFFKGVTATIARDTVFGVAYEVSRSLLRRQLGIQTLSNGMSCT